jgi:hypothetical protein
MATNYAEKSELLVDVRAIRLREKALSFVWLVHHAWKAVGLLFQSEQPHVVLPFIPLTSKGCNFKDLTPMR